MGDLMLHLWKGSNEIIHGFCPKQKCKKHNKHKSLEENNTFVRILDLKIVLLNSTICSDQRVLHTDKYVTSNCYIMHIEKITFAPN